MNSSPVYPIGILVMGTELRIEEPAATSRRVQRIDLDGRPRHRVCPFAYNVMRFASGGSLVPFIMVRNYSVKIDSIHALGPSLIQRVLFSAEMLYTTETTDLDGKLFYCPHRVLIGQAALEVRLRCLPELFMLNGPNVEQPEDWSIDAETLMKSHDTSQCDDCRDFHEPTGES